MDTARNIALGLSPLAWLAGFFALRAIGTPGCDAGQDLDCGLFYPVPEIASWGCVIAGAIHLGIVIYNLVSDRREGF